MIEIWVDPVHGNDGTGSPDPACGSGGIGHEVVRINNPGAPTKTIQVAIDIAAKYLRCHYDAQENPDQEAIVHLMPGIYGPATTFNGQVGNDEQFPIAMHDRVHLRGVNARRCVIRGVSTADGEYTANLKDNVLWPVAGACSSGTEFQDKQVLIDYSESGFYRRVGSSFEYHPWSADPVHGETVEFVDSVTLQGGDVQVLFGYIRELPWPLKGRIANCLFDLRHNITVEQGKVLTGAWIGLMVQTTWTDDLAILSTEVQVNGEGYLLQEVASINNTFLMAEFVWNGSSGTWNRSRSGAVGILDTADPICGFGTGTPGDPLQLIRGVNRLGVQNTLLRTHSLGAAAGTAEMAMVGVSLDDARVNTGTLFEDTNAFAIARAGSTSAVFDSPPYAAGAQTGTIFYQFLGQTRNLFLADVPTTPPQTPAVKNWDGNGGAAGPQVDPAFVGEYLRTVSPTKSSYRDWRLLPGSPLQNEGFAGTTSAFQSGAEFEEPECDPLQVLKWDHEQYGNLRVVDSAPDIGFDEVQLGVMAGSYANHSLSHNRSGVLNPFVPDEQQTRFLFLRRTVPGTTDPLQGRTLTLRSNEIVAGSTFRAWTEPPGSLSSPVPVSGPPAGYQYLYTSISSPVTWMGGYSATVPAPIGGWPNWQLAPQQPLIDLTLIQFQADDEGAGFASWVNVQPVISPITEPPTKPALLGNLQPEFR